MVWSVRRALPLALCLLALGALPGSSGANEVDTIGNLHGRWAGEGTMVPATGPSQNFRCVVTYFLTEEGSRIRQNLRCQGGNYKFDAATKLEIDAGQVTGVWTENTHALTGTVSGTVTQTGFDITLSGQFFQASMTVVSSDCQQSVKLVPARADLMKELTAALKKC
jgi:hypothetical protein